ncbi:MAG: segregation/condensation protein A [Deltaproteobacteria bacterium CG_4_10_14_0_2_um_filter_43_8]|nr:MAG: segregation/condensation protein A [Deltaproteobacteria bacterium CG11_big_fil_rev_8_21_14_0_20_42_23]PJA19989.1 MAG: segregation/condensation protein A [Deltaproteobacteria bacterium CG_4_10_14_0_2_um_filter_43_8]PJC64645.1 MAG: segregation/condensation protein A [Deltaproteobacteria bacterium CG_4_9_14_0_2_um_filter_42_21]
MEATQFAQDYRVNLDAFEGPLDILLHLIKKNDIDVYNIPITFVLEEYMKYIEEIKDIDIDFAGEFLLMASELAHIKSRLLLPIEEQGVLEDEGNDPRASLVERLLEYQKYKEAGNQLEGRAQLGRDVFLPQSPERVKPTHDGPLEVDIYELLEAFGKLIARVPEKKFHGVGLDRISVNARIYQLMDRIQKDATTTMEEILTDVFDVYDVIITFLSLLEMCRLKMIKLYQIERGGTIYLRGSVEKISEEERMKIQVDEYGSVKSEES